MRKDFLLACNFKNNLVDVNEYQSFLAKTDQKNIIILPSFLQIGQFSDVATNFGAQNVCEFIAGSHTGEVDIKMLKNIGAKFCIVGHSERRKDWSENSQQINTKLKNLLAEDITPILCVGESTAADMEQLAFAKVVVKKQLEAELEDIDKSKIIVAYEPIWAIGTGKVADCDYILKICDYIKKEFAVSKVLYGGSVNVQNLEDISKIACVDGVLIGKACLNANNIEIMQSILNK